MKLAHSVASWSKDTTKVGAYIVDSSRIPMSHGYNGMPRGINDDIKSRLERPTKYFYMEHAERNAIYNAKGRNLSGTTMYVTHFPCADCTRAIIQNGISHIVVERKNGLTGTTALRFPDNYSASLDMLTEAKITITYIDTEDKDV
jgi:dCMP deaminase